MKVVVIFVVIANDIAPSAPSTTVPFVSVVVIAPMPIDRIIVSVPMATRNVTLLDVAVFFFVFFIGAP